MTLPANWTLVPAVATPHQLEDAVHAFVEAMPHVIGTVTDEELARAVSVAVGHCALECGNFGMKLEGGEWTPSNPPTLLNENLGNTRPGQHEVCEVTHYRCNELIGGKVVWYTPPQDESTFRSFRRFALGVLAQLLFLGRPESRYHQAWLRLLAGDPAGFVQQLKLHGYMTGDEGPYERAVVSIFGRVLPIARRVIAGEHHGVTDEDREHVADQVALSLDTISREFDAAEPFPLDDEKTDPGSPPPSATA